MMAIVGEGMCRVQMKFIGRMSLEPLVPDDVVEAEFLSPF